MFANSVAVAAIGVLASRILRPHNDTAGQAYLIARTGEAVPLTVGSVFLLVGAPNASGANEYCYQLAMLSLGVDSLPLGAAGEISGHAVGVALSVPGGLFEVTFGALLLARGLPGNGATDDRPRPVSPATR